MGRLNSGFRLGLGDGGELSRIFRWILSEHRRRGERGSPGHRVVALPVVQVQGEGDI